MAVPWMMWRTALASWALLTVLLRRHLRGIFRALGKPLMQDNTETAHSWLANHSSSMGPAPYTFGHFKAAYLPLETPHLFVDASDRERLYWHVLDMHANGTPLVLLARQALVYPLFFDIDIYGGLHGSADWDAAHRLIWLDDEHVFFRVLAQVLLELFSDIVDRHGGVKMLVFGSSGLCSKLMRFKASYHVVLPDILVERPELCLPGHTWTGHVGGHVRVRDHVVCRLTEISESGPLQELQDALFHCCDESVESFDETADLTKLNDWTEVFDENPLWYDPRPDACTGLRLPFTDKAMPQKGERDPRGGTEGRTKEPLGVLLFEGPEAACTTQPLPTQRELLRAGDVAGNFGNMPSNLQEAALHEDVSYMECPCLVCAGKR